mgnify:CR=1 FL=1
MTKTKIWYTEEKPKPKPEDSTSGDIWISINGVDTEHFNGSEWKPAKTRPTTPQDVWDFAYRSEYMERYEYIQSLPEYEQEWVAALLHYFDLVFRLHVEHKTRPYPHGAKVDVEDVRKGAYKLANPSNSEPWREKYDPAKFTW